MERGGECEMPTRVNKIFRFYALDSRRTKIRQHSFNNSYRLLNSAHRVCQRLLNGCPQEKETIPSFKKDITYRNRDSMSLSQETCEDSATLLLATCTHTSTDSV